MILGCVTILIPVKYRHLQKLVLGTAIIGWIWYGYIFYHSICALFVAILKKVYNNWLWVQLFLADHNVDTSILMQYVHYLIRFLKRSTNTGFGCREVHMNICSGYITCWHLGNEPDPKKVQFVSQITLGVNESCLRGLVLLNCPPLLH